MALINSPKPDSPEIVRDFFGSSCFELDSATEAMQEFLSERFGRWVKRHEKLIGNTDVWTAWTLMLQHAVDATGRFKYNAMLDVFVPQTDDPERRTRPFTAEELEAIARVVKIHEA